MSPLAWFLLRTSFCAKELGQDFADGTAGGSVSAIQTMINALPLSEAWDILDAMKKVIDEDRSSARTLLESYPQLVLLGLLFCRWGECYKCLSYDNIYCNVVYFIGYLTYDQFHQVMERMNLGISSQEVRFVISEADENQNGVIDFDEFVRIVADLIQSFHAKSKAKNMFIITFSSSSH
jgi:hypothetical protein